MEKLDVRIIKLDPMRVASVRAVSRSPEGEAFEKMEKWAGPKGFLKDLAKHPIFGFDNPSPSKDSPEYGYEVWIKVGTEIVSDKDVEIKEFGGGLYAVYTCDVKGDPWKSIPAAWKKLRDWVKSSDYVCDENQWLEKPTQYGVSLDELKLDLYYPIKKK